MLAKSLLISSAIIMAAAPGLAEARNEPVAGNSKPRSDINAGSGQGAYYPGRRSFYEYPRHRHIDGGGGASNGRPVQGGEDRSPNFDAYYGSAYYGINYGAPYHGGAYYDGGVYHRERRD